MVYNAEWIEQGFSIQLYREKVSVWMGGFERWNPHPCAEKGAQTIWEQRNHQVDGFHFQNLPWFIAYSLKTLVSQHTEPVSGFQPHKWYLFKFFQGGAIAAFCNNRISLFTKILLHQLPCDSHIYFVIH